MLTQFAVTIGAWLCLLFASTNLVGFLVRGLFTNPELNRLEIEGHDFAKEAVRQHRRTEQTVNIVALILVVAFLLALDHFWNAGVVLAATMLMVARITDLLWEMKHGSKLQLKEMRHPALWMLNTVLSWASLPALWYALYGM
jgi:hypothetical protein